MNQGGTEGTWRQVQDFEKRHVTLFSVRKIELITMKLHLRIYLIETAVVRRFISSGCIFL